MSKSIKYILVILMYSAAYQFMHVNFLYRHFESAGYISNIFSPLSYLITQVIILVPLFVRNRLKDNIFLDVNFTFLYFLLFIPLMITFLNHYSKSCNVFMNQLFFLLNFLIIFVISAQKKIKIYRLNLRPPNPATFVLLSLIVMSFLFYENRHTYSFVSFSDVYIQREYGKSKSLISGYLTMWNTYLFGPFLISLGFGKKSKFLILVGALSIIFVYGINASKIALFIPIIMFLFYFIIKYKIDLILALGLSFFGMIVLFSYLPDDFFMISAVVLMRTFGIPGLLTYQYLEFFNYNPFTYYSHLNFVNILTNGYPFKQELGFVVSSFFFDSENNANANFWATDGVAALGLIGVSVISIVLGFFLLYLKSLLTPVNSNLLGFMAISFVFLILNIGLFTSILSGGFLFFIIYLHIWKK